MNPTLQWTSSWTRTQDVFVRQQDKNVLIPQAACWLITKSLPHALKLDRNYKDTHPGFLTSS